MKHKLDDDTWFPFFPSFLVAIVVVVKLSFCATKK